jgi:hypothetical protein
MTKRLTWDVTTAPPRVHFAHHGPWTFAIKPLTTNRFSAWFQRVGWERADSRLFRELQAAKDWCEAECAKIEGEHA